MNKISQIKEIKTGYVVKMANGDLMMCMPFDQDRGRKVFVNERGNCVSPPYCAGLDMTGDVPSRNFIVEVYGLSENGHTTLKISTDGRPLLYSILQKIPPKKMTIREIEDKLGYEIEIVGEHHDR